MSLRRGHEGYSADWKPWAQWAGKVFLCFNIYMTPTNRRLKPINFKNTLKNSIQFTSSCWSSKPPLSMEKRILLEPRAWLTCAQQTILTRKLIEVRNTHSSIYNLTSIAPSFARPIKAKETYQISYGYLMHSIFRVSLRKILQLIKFPCYETYK